MMKVCENFGRERRVHEFSCCGCCLFNCFYVGVAWAHVVMQAPRSEIYTYPNLDRYEQVDGIVKARHTIRSIMKEGYQENHSMQGQVSMWPSTTITMLGFRATRPGREGSRKRPRDRTGASPEGQLTRRD